MIRPAREEDAEVLAHIYNQAMKPGIYATAFVTPVTRENRLVWLRQLCPPFGVWVYVSGSGEVLGWCSLSPFAPRANYPLIAEVSAYVEENHRFGSIGGHLLACMVIEARRRGFRSLVSIVFEKNVVSIAGCFEAGFQPRATLYAAATFDKVHENVSWIQKDLSAPDPPVLRRLLDALRAEEQ
jgi:L-amino acid N-acyltransferase YncA